MAHLPKITLAVEQLHQLHPPGMLFLGLKEGPTITYES
jgi:hypothetical protein